MPKEIGYQNPKVNNLVNLIANGEVKIPPLQRPFVWEVDQIIELLESIYKEYPIGSILWWETNQTLPAERNVAGFLLPQRPESHPFYYVLDGQQRISSLYGVFCSDRTVDAAATGEYKVDHSVFEILFDLEEKKFLHKDQINPNGKYLELKALFDPQRYADAVVRVSADPELRAVVTGLYDKFTNYEVPVIVTKKREPDEVGVIFERVNNTGTALDLFDLMAALTWSPEFHLRDSLNEILEILEQKNFGGIKKKILLQGISVILCESSKTKAITSLNRESVRQNISLLKESLKKTIDFLSTQFNVGSDEVLPHSHQIVPLCYFFSKVNAPSVAHVSAIKKWFWKTSFSHRYSSGTDKNIDEDVQAFKTLIESGDAAHFEKLRYSVNEDVLKNTKLLRSNSLSRAFLVLLASKNPLDLTNGTRIDVGAALSSFNKREYHHVFPEAFLRGRGIHGDQINSLCNYALLPAASNKIISDDAPSVYFQNKIPRHQYKEILESNLFPLRQEIYERDDYGQFVDARAKLVMQYIDSQVAL